ncbi:hypothetical protein ACR77J_16345 [Tissierella praeacuta]|uniref:hypothetical protein n=1 Tax=Tissierella praeacuta TaxID=43131 RepID=UPI003DA1F80D
MILVSLIDELENIFKKLFKDNIYETKSKQYKVPEIKTGWYTVKGKKPEEELPYILISPVIQDDTMDGSTVELLIIFAAHSMDLDGWKDSALMAEKVRQYLEIHHTINGKYEISDSLKIIFPDEQPYPQWFCWMNVKFTVYKPELEEVYYD